MAEVLGFEEFQEVKQVVDMLVPGYYRRAVDPFEALENQQGNCFTNAVIGAMVCSEMFQVEASMAWSSRLHATPRQTEGIGGNTLKTSDRDTVPHLNISHVELVVPRGVDQFDVLGLGYGLNVRDGKAFEKEDQGGIITNYNFPNIAPERVDVIGLAEKEDAMLEIADGGEIVPTSYGRELSLESMDWQHAADEYLAALGLPPLKFDQLLESFTAKVAAMRGWQQLGESVARHEPMAGHAGFSDWHKCYYSR